MLYVKVYPYPCIRVFASAKVQISRASAYPRVLDLVKSRPDTIFLDVGCCCMNQSISRSFLNNLICPKIVGTELRKVIHDGWPVSQTIATDLEAGMTLSWRPNSSLGIHILSYDRILGPGTQTIQNLTRDIPCKVLGRGCIR